MVRDDAPVTDVEINRMVRILAGLVGLALVACVSSAHAAAPEPTPAMVVDAEIKVVTLAAGERLTEDENAHVTAGTLAALAKDHDNVLKYYRNKVAYEAKADKDHTYTASLRRTVRGFLDKALTTYPEDSIDGVEARIVARHDPVVAADPGRNLLFTRRSVTDLHAGAAWLAGLLDVPGPTAGFDGEIATMLRAQIRQIDQAQATDMMMVGQNQVNAQDWFQHSDQGVVANLKPKLRATVLRQTAASQNLVLAQSAGTVAAMGAKNAQALVQGMMMNIMKLNMMGMAHQGTMVQLNQMTQRQQTQTQRRASPACMTGGAGLSWCNNGNE